ncbi:alpha-E domain-containing protein [Myxococcota bacterium]|nr:alpha-E domain-containing protein [Myxococcota bacterium]
MISRVADHCFWLGRYLERAESTARLLQVTATLSLDAELSPRQCWQPVVITVGEQERFERLLGADAFADGEKVQHYLSFHPDVPVSLIQSIAAARENARSIREVISLEVWESINELHLWVQSPAAWQDYDGLRYGFYKRIRSDIQLAQGLVRSTMLDDTPLWFIWLGTMLERTGQTARILDVHHHAFSLLGDASKGGSSVEREARSATEVALWLSLLRACYGFEPFTKTHRGSVTGQAVAAFLIFEPRFPRAVRHCLRRARETLTQIRPPELPLPPLRSLERLKALETWLDTRRGALLDPAQVHEILTEVVDETHAAAGEIAHELLGAMPPVSPRPLPMTQAATIDAAPQA